MHTSFSKGDEQWRAELIRLGGMIHQDEDGHLDDEADAVQQAQTAQFWGMVDAIDGTEHEDVAIALMRAIHPIEDYGIYESVYSALRLFAPHCLGTAAARELPMWLTRNPGDPRIEIALMSVPQHEESEQAFLKVASEWKEDERQAVLEAIRAWAEETESWDKIYEQLGGDLADLED